MQDIANVLKKHQTVLQNAKQKTKGMTCAGMATPVLWF